MTEQKNKRYSERSSETSDKTKHHSTLVYIHTHAKRERGHVYIDIHIYIYTHTHTQKIHVISFDNPSHPRRFLPFNKNRPGERRPSQPKWRNRRRRISPPGTTVISQLLRKIVTCNYDNTAARRGPARKRISRMFDDVAAVYYFRVLLGLGEDRFASSV